MPAKSNSPQVVWLSRARQKLRQLNLQPRHDQELALLFQERGVHEITVCDVYSGYLQNEEQRIILAVQVQEPDAVGSHIVKLGSDSEVRPDLEGYRNCLLGRGQASRMLMPVSGKQLAEDRWGVIYQNAYSLFGVQSGSESPHSLEEAAKWAITDREPTIDSIERVLMQVFSELYRICYRGGTPDAEGAQGFYNRKLSSKRSGGRSGGRSAWETWDDENHRLLRRDAMWLATAQRNPESTEVPDYLDPYDYLGWALKEGQVPSTSIGWSHGDLHGLNVLVGVARGEAEHPAIFDFGDMRQDNVQVWDFVKLETELKTRLMPALGSPDATAALERIVGGPRAGCQKVKQRQKTELARAANRAEELEFALLFECWLARVTEEMTKGAEIARSRAGIADSLRSGQPDLDNALTVFLRIRREAGSWLGFENRRANDWREEYYFALAVYGLLKARWQPEERHLQWALFSSGVAVAQLKSARSALMKGFHDATDPRPAMSTLPSHLIAQHWGRKLWQSKKNAEACELLEKATQQFPAAVSLLLERALNLAANDEPDEAEKLLTPLIDYCQVFGDHEALTRIGRVYKNRGDNDWKHSRSTFNAIKPNHPTLRNYNLAFIAYRQAFKIHKHYFPGINAASLALLTKQQEDARQLAEEVLRLCTRIGATPRHELKWCFATEGEAKLILGKPKEAADSYAAALRECGDDAGAVSSMYDQVCRLHWALGSSKVRKVVLLFEKCKLNWNGKNVKRPFYDCQSPRAGKVTGVSGGHGTSSTEART